jgi:hypothetical protein
VTREPEGFERRPDEKLFLMEQLGQLLTPEELRQWLEKTIEAKERP